MGRTVGLILRDAGEACAKGMEDGIAAAGTAPTGAENEKAVGEKRLTKAEVVEKLNEKGIEFDKKERLEDLMKLLEGEGKDGGNDQAG